MCIRDRFQGLTNKLDPRKDSSKAPPKVGGKRKKKTKRKKRKKSRKKRTKRKR